jgi:hypothetical protein
MTSFLLVCTPLQWSPPRFISSSAHVSAADLQCPKQRVAGERTCRLPRRQLLVVPAGWRGGGFNYLVRSAPATGVSVRQKVETPAGQMVVGVKHSAVHVGMESALVWSEHVSFETIRRVRLHEEITPQNRACPYVLHINMWNIFCIILCLILFIYVHFCSV